MHTPYVEEKSHLALPIVSCGAHSRTAILVIARRGQWHSKSLNALYIIIIIVYSKHIPNIDSWLRLVLCKTGEQGPGGRKVPGSIIIAILCFQLFIFGICMGYTIIIILSAYFTYLHWTYWVLLTSCGHTMYIFDLLILETLGDPAKVHFSLYLSATVCVMSGKTSKGTDCLLISTDEGNSKICRLEYDLHALGIFLWWHVYCQ